MTLVFGWTLEGMFWILRFIVYLRRDYSILTFPLDPRIEFWILTFPMDLRRDRWTRSQPPSLDPGYFECDSLYRVSRLMVLHVGGVTLRAIPYKHAQSRDVPCFVTRGCKYTTTVCSTVTKFVSMFFCYLRLFVFVITLFFIIPHIVCWMMFWIILVLLFWLLQLRRPAFVKTWTSTCL